MATELYRSVGHRLAPVAATRRHPGLEAIISLVDIWIERRRQRRALAGLSDSMLKDIGLSRGEAHRESSKPFWQA